MLTTLLAAATTAAAKATSAPIKLTPQQLQQMLQNQPALTYQHQTPLQAHAGWLTHTLAGFFIVAALSLIGLLAVQTTKQEGLSGTIGGRVDSAYRGRLGFEGQIARVTGIVAIAFVVIATLVSLSGISNLAEPVLDVKDLATTFKTDDGLVRAVNGLSFSVQAGTTLGIVGESGSGKSVTALSIMRLIPQPPGRIERGEVLFRGRDLLELSESEMRKIRGKDVAMIFQDPMTSLNPVLNVGEQIAEAARLHLGYNKKEALDKAVEMLRLVKIPAAEARVRDYPHQFSGGMRQRVMIAMALSCDPAVLIADEPTTALDVTIQAQIIELMNEMQQRLGSAIILITHDLGVVAETCKNVLVMYGGNMVEYGTADDIFNRPKMPYTMGLLESLPRLDAAGERLVPIEGQPPNLLRMPPGCAFAPRCRYKMPICSEPVPLYDFGAGHVARCVLYDERTAGSRTLPVETAPRVEREVLR